MSSGSAEILLTAQQVEACVGSSTFDAEKFDTLAGGNGGITKTQVKLLLPDEFSSQDFDAICQYCAANDTSFVDPDFPPTLTSLYSPQDVPAKEEPIVWRRPKDFMKKNASGERPFVVFEGIEPGDIKQGRLGDCWFLCALASLAEYPQLIQDLFEPNSTVPNEAGVYQLRFCKNGQWRTVTVDDRLPCKSFSLGRPVYAGSNGSELWAMLAEKAYAKLHGSYSSIEGGWEHQALMDMTGDPVERFKFNDPAVAASIASGEFWDKLVYADSVGYVLSVSTAGEDVLTSGGSRPATGLVPGHAYSLIGAKQLSNGVRVVLIRNPWGSMEWSGDWSDSSPLWTEEYRAEVADTKHRWGEEGANDGMFWMTYNDMLANFVLVAICMCRTPGVHPKPWKELRKKTFFSYDPDKHDVTPSILCITPAADTMAIFTIHQADTRMRSAKPYVDAGVSVLRLVGGESAGSSVSYEYVGSSRISAEREMSVEVPMLRAGERYIVVPVSTGGTFHKQDMMPAGSGGVALFDATQNAGGLSALTTVGENVVDEVFDRFDLNMQEGLDELCLMTMLAQMKPDWTAGVRRKKIAAALGNFHTKPNGTLSKRGFRCAMAANSVHCFNGHVQDPAARQAALLADVMKLGYDDDLNLCGARGVVLSVHSEEDMTSRPMPPTMDAHNGLPTTNDMIHDEAIEQCIMNNGSADEMKGWCMYKLKHGYSGVSFVAANTTRGETLIVTMTVKGTNCMNVTGGELAVTVEVPPGEANVLIHLMPDQVDKAWGYSYSTKTIFRPHGYVKSTVPPSKKQEKLAALAARRLQRNQQNKAEDDTEPDEEPETPQAPEPPVAEPAAAAVEPPAVPGEETQQEDKGAKGGKGGKKKGGMFGRIFGGKK